MDGRNKEEVPEEPRRAPVQGDGPYYLAAHHPSVQAYKGVVKPPGTIMWEEHLVVYAAYAARFGRSQSAERIAERGGFSFAEATWLLGRELVTWEPLKGAR